jgi:hypothetical protein
MSGHAQEIETPLPLCTGCNKHPADIKEYVNMGQAEDMTPDDFVRREEGTYNPENGHFLCTSCYIKAGQPSVKYPGRWIAP